MGINFRHNDTRSAAQWSYSGFGHFRCELASLIGIELAQMVGFGGEQEWSSLPPDPIHLLLDHSDCDGELSPDDCAKIAPRLSELAALLEDGYDSNMGEKLAQTMIHCALNGETLEFC